MRQTHIIDNRNIKEEFVTSTNIAFDQ